MSSDREYQYDFSSGNHAMLDADGREKKAATMVAVLSEYFDAPLGELRVFDIGASTGIIGSYLADYFHSVAGIDIDEKAIAFAKEKFRKKNLDFRLGDAMDTGLQESSVDVVICSQIYEHVPDASAMMREIFRILRPGGVCYFAAGNRLMWNEPHYNLPLLSVVPRPLAHWYIRLAGKADHYHELHFSYWGLKKLVRCFEVVDYTAKIIMTPEVYNATYMLPKKSKKRVLAQILVKHAYCLVPGYIWLLRKPDFQEIPQ